MNSSVQKHLQLILDWVDKGFSTGARKAKLDIDELKKKAKDLARDLALVAAAFAGTTIALFKFIEAGAKMKDVAGTFNRVRAAAGLLPGVLGDIRDATHGTISDMDLMKSSAAALANSLDPSRLVEFWAKATQISAVSGGTVSKQQAFEALSLSITKLNTLNLSAIGITIRTEDAFERYARTIGKTTDQLNYHDKQMAISIDLEAKYQSKFAALGDITSGTAQRFEQFSTGVVNLKNKFLMMLASSPSIDKFMQMLVDKVGKLSSDMDTWEPKIKAVVDGLIHFYEGLVQFASDKAGPAIENIYKYRDAIAAVAAVVGTGIVASKIMGIGVALGLVTGVTAAGIVALAAGIAGIAVAVDNTTKGTRDMEQAFQGFRPGMDFIPMMRPAKEEIKATIVSIDELLAKRSMLQMPGTTPPSASTIGPLKGAGVSDKWAGEPLVSGELKGIQFTADTEKAIYDERFQTKRNYNESCRELVMRQSDWENEMLWLGEQQAHEAIEMRMAAYQKGYSVMGQWTQKFYTHSANMGRTFNAMMIAGFGEMAAAYIEAKIAQYKMDVMEYSLMAIVMLARGNFVKAALYGQAAAQAALIAGAGMLAAGAIRSWSQGKAEAISSQQEIEFNAAAAGGDGGSGVAQRRQATGIVNTRPIAINVYSTVNLNSGYMIFGDGEGAVNELYEGQIRTKIEGDIESGMLQVA